MTKRLTMFMGLAAVGVLAASSWGCLSSEGTGQPELLVFAAASLVESLDEIGQSFEAESGIRLSVSYGGSQTLARQIAAGAPADVLLSAAEPPMEELAAQGHVDPDWIGFASNTLVVAVGPNGPRPQSLAALAEDDIEVIAVADPRTAPAGYYAKEALDSLTLWNVLEDKMLMGPDVRATMGYVQSGNADVAIVYRTDAAAAGLTFLDIVPVESYPRVVYPAGVVSDSDDPTEAREFISFLRSEKARRVLQANGFRPLVD